MNVRKFAVAAFLAFSFVSLSATEALACACCAEPGTYYLQTFKPRSYEIDLISRFEFAPTAKLYLTEAGFDNIEGLEAVRKEDEADFASITQGFDLAAAFSGKRVWKFDFKTAKGLRGSLTLPMPTQMVSYAVDIHDNEEGALGPLLYKEFRFKGNVLTATGFAKAGVVRGTTFFLVFQGRGRGCDEVNDFKNWRLEIDGPRAGYAFFGKLTSADEPQSE